MELSFVEKKYCQGLEKSKSLYIIASVTRQCVLQCRYCYAVNPKNNRLEIMFDNVLEKIIKDAFFTSRSEITFEWSGGESFLAGISFYKKVIQFQEKWKREGKSFTNCIQTSGMVYNENLIDFFVKNKFHIGITIDGEKETHDFQRPTVTGKGSYDSVIRTFRYIKKKQGTCGTLCTITKKNVHSPEKISQTFTAIGVNGWHSNFYAFDANKPLKDQLLAISADDYFGYLKKQADYFIDNQTDENVPKTLKMLLFQLSGLKYNSLCTYSGSCIGRFINFDHEGNVSLCQKFLGSTKHSMGHILENSIGEMISPNHEVTSSFIRQRAQATIDCLDDKCEYFNICKSGCPYISTLSHENRDMNNRELLCDAKKKLFRYLEKKLEIYSITPYSSQIKWDRKANGT